MEKQLKNFILFCCCGLLLTKIACSTSKHISNQNIRLVNRDIVPQSNTNQNVISLNRKRGDGLAIIKNIQFETGIIELDLRGEDLQGKSFIGLAFNIENDSTYETVYFRPFNFQAKDKSRREHGMQYIHHPEFTWKKLRTEQQGVFEAEFVNPPDPDDWFTIRLTINEKTVLVHDKKTEKLLMKINRLTQTKSNTIAFWTGFNSKGSFRNLKIIE